MSSLRRDLIEKRLWPLVVILILAIAAVPFLLARRSQASATIIPAVPAPGAASSKPATTQAHGKPVSVSAERRALHRLTHQELRREATRNPFLAAPAWTGAKKTTSGGTATTTTVAATSPTSTGSAASGSAASGSASSGSVTAPGSGSTTPASGSPTVGAGTTVTSEGTSAGTPGGAAPTSTVTQTVTETTTAPTQTTTAAHVPDGPVGSGPWTMYTVDVRSATFSFSTHKLGPVTTHKDVARLTPLPSVASPKVMFTGVTDHGHQAVFALAAGVEAKGKGHCLPDASVCSAIAMPAGAVETLTWYGSDGSPDERAFQVSKLLGTVTNDRTKAAQAFARHSRAGQCELDLSDPLQYDDTSGSVSSTTAQDCSKVKGAVPFPGGSGS